MSDEPLSGWETVDAHFDEDRVIEDGFGNAWVMCEDVDCGLEVVRPGKVQCWCDLRGECDGP